jgi:Asp-tRNA(Asn)/Glu-tRNA(Gln) amidotransferase A subunit family amidase
MGMQFLAPLGADQAVLEFGLSYESVTDHLARRPSFGLV